MSTASGSAGPRRGLRFCFSVETDDPSIAQMADLLFADLVAEAQDVDHRLVVVARPGRDGFAVLADGYVVATRARPSDVASLLSWLVTQGAVHHDTGLLLLHAAVVAAGGRGVLLPAISGTGKSTLATALILRGMDYLTDEVGAIEPGALRLRAYPKALSLARGALELLPNGPDLGASAGIPFAGSGRELHLPASFLRPGCVATSAVPELVVFPERTSAGVSSLEPLRPAAAMSRLVGHSFNLVSRPEVLFEVCAQLCRGVESFVLKVADVASACDLLEALVGAPAADSGVR